MLPFRLSAPLFPALALLSLTATACGNPSLSEESRTAGLRAGAETPGTPSPRLAAEIIKCHDGDTCTARIYGVAWEFRVRLAGIDAPEVKSRITGNGQALGDEARDYLNNLVSGKKVEMTQLEIDPYNRSLVEIFIGNRNINKDLLAKGLADYYEASPRALDKTSYQAVLEKAKKAKVGIWGLENYQSPSDYRKSLRENTGT